MQLPPLPKPENEMFTADEMRKYAHDYGLHIMVSMAKDEMHRRCKDSLWWGRQFVGPELWDRAMNQINRAI